MKTFLVYATEDSTLIGNRQRVYDDWKVGDTIMSNGRETKIVAIYSDTRRNWRIIAAMFQDLRRVRTRRMQPASRLALLKEYCDELSVQ